MSDPYVSSKVRAERDAEAARFRKISALCGGGVLLVALVAVLLAWNPFSGTNKASQRGKISPEVADVQELNSLDEDNP